MKEKFKKLPLSVQIASVFLVIAYLAMICINPQFALFLTLVLGTIVSIIRIIMYLVREE